MPQLSLSAGAELRAGVLGLGRAPLQTTLRPRGKSAFAWRSVHRVSRELDRIPEHLLVIGGGYVGVELSQAMRRFGSKVSVIDRNRRLMSREDEDVCDGLSSLLEDEGIDVLLNSAIKRVSGKSGDSVSIVIEQEGA